MPQIGVEELLSLALATERRGAAFYQALAAGAPEGEVRRLLQRLAEEEQEHAAWFQKLGRLAGTINGHAAMYVHSLLAEDPFAGPRSGTKPPADLKEGLQLAVQAEKNAILLYTELSSLAVEPSGRQLLNDLLEAEKMHLVELRREMEETDP